MEDPDSNFLNDINEIQSYDKYDKKSEDGLKNTSEIISEISLEIRNYIYENALPIAEKMTLEDIVDFLNIQI